MTPDLLTTTQAAKVLGNKPGTLANWRNFGVGPKFERVKKGNRLLVRYRRSDLQSFLKGDAQ